MSLGFLLRQTILKIQIQIPNVEKQMFTLVHKRSLGRMREAEGGQDVDITDS